MSLSRRGGFALPELIVSLALLGVIMSAVMGVILSMQKGYVRQREVSRAEDALRVGETTLANILRMATANPMKITGASAPAIYANPLGAATFDNVRVVADFNPPNGNVDQALEDIQVWVQSDTMYVRWQAGQVGAPVAYPVRSLLFAYDSSGTALTTTADVARAANRVKVTLTAPRHSRTGALARRDIWVHFRNRS
jgi:prepilin-type N-terminal cleavage/methylation domain-containing protein